MTHIAVTLPVRIVSVANMREHWAKKANRAKQHRIGAWAELRRFEFGRLIGPTTVTLTRIAPRKLDDDNLRSAFKNIRDGVADWLGVPDNHPMIRWDYRQETGAPKQYAARIEVKAEL